MLDSLVIDRASAIPYYFQLKQALSDEIRSGQLPPGSRLPSEPELCERFGISRTTVRQALSELEAEGMLRREKGRGTFVAPLADRSTFLQSASGFFDEALRAGRDVSSRVLRWEREALPGWASRALEQPAGAVGLTLERLRYLDGQVVMYAVTHLPDAVGAGIEAELLERRSLYQLLGERQGLKVGGGRRVVEAVRAPAHVQRLLEVEDGAPLLFVESASWTADRVPFECYRAWHRSDRVKIEIKVLGDSEGRPAPA